MNTESPQLPHKTSVADHSAHRNLKRFATAFFIVGLLVLAYGAIAFWWIRSLPPNNLDHGRLPSLYVMGFGIAITLVGLVARDLRLWKKAREPSPSNRQGIPAVYGILVLFAIIAVFFIVVSQM